VGLLFPALSEPGVEMLRQEYERELHFAPDVVMLDEAETLRAAPILAPGSVHGALFQPDAYQVDTGRVMRALDGELRAAASTSARHRRRGRRRRRAAASPAFAPPPARSPPRPW
jgi:glycine/D-amino acid oxidase-like deaminating enzyme